MCAWARSVEKLKLFCISLPQPDPFANLKRKHETFLFPPQKALSEQKQRKNFSIFLHDEHNILLHAGDVLILLPNNTEKIGRNYEELLWILFLRFA